MDKKLRFRSEFEKKRKYYLFRALLQQNNQVLKAIICSLLHLDQNQVRKVTVENPIELGKSYDEKDFILDIRALLNDNIIINLEMQVINQHNWQERSLCYLCRSFENLNRGEQYSSVKPAVQIGFLNFTLFSDSPEFYATYYMKNDRTNEIYSDKLRLSVVDLTKIELATETDRAYGIDLWAKFFKCIDWSELVMLAKENSDIQAAVGTVYQLSREEKIRQQCEAREDYYRREKDRQMQIQWMEKTQREIEVGQRELETGRRELETGRRELETGQRELETGRRELETGRRELETGRRELESGRRELEEKQQELEEKQQEYRRKQQENQRKEQELQEREEKLLIQKRELEKRIRELENSSKENR